MEHGRSIWLRGSGIWQEQKGDLAGGSGREHERGERRTGSRGGEENTSPSAAGCERAERPRFCPFRPASRGPPVPFSLSFSLSANKDFCDVDMDTARLRGFIILALRPSVRPTEMELHNDHPLPRFLRSPTRASGETLASIDVSADSLSSGSAKI